LFFRGRLSADTLASRRSRTSREFASSRNIASALLSVANGDAFDDIGADEPDTVKTEGRAMDGRLAQLDADGRDHRS
jgi:hypothetical protein